MVPCPARLSPQASFRVTFAISPCIHVAAALPLGGQVSWIQAQKGDAKKAGILAAVAKVPTLLKKLQASADAAVSPRERARSKVVKEKEKVQEEKDEASFFCRLFGSLFASLSPRFFCDVYDHDTIRNW